MSPFRLPTSRPAIDRVPYSKRRFQALQGAASAVQIIAAAQVTGEKWSGDLQDTLYVTPLDMSVIAHRPNSPPFTQPAIPRSENNTPGVGIRRNGDHDNGNDAIPDYDAPGPIASENDLIKVEVAVARPSIEGISWVLVRDANTLNVYWNADKEESILGNTSGNEYVFSTEDLEGPNPRNIYIEWATMNTATTTATLRLEARTATGAMLAVEQITFHPFTSIVVVFGGWDAGPPTDAGPGYDSSATSGAYAIGHDLYYLGYDVHMYEHDQWNTLAYTEVVSATSSRGVTSIAIIGHSWGADATWELAHRLLQEQLGGQLGTFTIAYTAYIDAVASDLTPLTLRPWGSMWHLNIYETNTLFPHGGPMYPDDPDPTMRANENIDETSNGLGHTTIDDDQL